MSRSQDKRICVLGSADDLYTKMVVHHLCDADIEFDLLLVGSQRSAAGSGVASKVCALWAALHQGKYKALSKWSPFVWKMVIRDAVFTRSRKGRQLRSSYSDIQLDQYEPWYTPSVNHVRTYLHLSQHAYDFGVFAGVGIVAGEIISTFTSGCINAHPAPLPECRGAGAIQFTLAGGFTPAVSVHIATADIDAGPIYRVTPIPIHEDETMASLSLRSSMVCAEELADVVRLLANGISPPVLENSGPLNYWKDCSLAIQKKAERRLRALRSDRAGLS